METRDERCAALLGCFNRLTLDVRLVSLSAVSTQGHWDSLTSKTLSWLCKCGRSEPIIILKKVDSERVASFDGVHACEVCREEKQKAYSTSHKDFSLRWLSTDSHSTHQGLSRVSSRRRPVQGTMR